MPQRCPKVHSLQSAANLSSGMKNECQARKSQVPTMSRTQGAIFSRDKVEENYNLLKGT